MSELPPIPRPGRASKYPFRSMDIGTSFTIPQGTMEFYSAQIYCYTRNRVLKPKRFTCVENPDGSIVVTRRS
jgi:hypothetical protein